MRYSGVGLALGLSFCVPCLDANIIVGTNNTNANLFPFNDSYFGEYQQLYAGAAFPAIQTITGLSFASAFVSTPDAAHTLTLAIGLSTTSATVAAMSTNYASNEGRDFTQVFSGAVTFAPAGNNTFDLQFATTPFTYNPAAGNLLLDVLVTGNSGVLAAYQANQDNVTSRVFNLGGTGAPAFTQGYGLVTNFETPVPEPATNILLLGAGFVLLGFRHAMRFRSRREH